MIQTGIFGRLEQAPYFADFYAFKIVISILLLLFLQYIAFETNIENEIYISTRRAARNMSYQGFTPKEGVVNIILELTGQVFKNIEMLKTRNRLITLVCTRTELDLIK